MTLARIFPVNMPQPGDAVRGYVALCQFRAVFVGFWPVAVERLVRDQAIRCVITPLVFELFKPLVADFLSFPIAYPRALLEKAENVNNGTLNEGCTLSKTLTRGKADWRFSCTFLGWAASSPEVARHLRQTHIGCCLSRKSGAKEKFLSFVKLDLPMKLKMEEVTIMR